MVVWRMCLAEAEIVPITEVLVPTPRSPLGCVLSILVCFHSFLQKKKCTKSWELQIGSVI